MKARFWAALTIAATGILRPGVSHADGCYAGSQNLGTFPLAPTPDAHIATLLPLGNKPRLMMIDTGGANSEISDEVANDLDLTPKSVPTGIQVDLLGHQVTQYVVVPKFRIGDAVFKDVGFSVFSRGDRNGAIPDADGVLAPDILRAFDVDLDFGVSQIRFFANNHCPGKISFWSPTYASAPFDTDTSGHIIVSMTLDGKPVQVTFDTGAPHSLMSMAAANRLFGLAPGTAGMEEAGLWDDKDPTQKVYRHRFVSLAVDGLQVKNPLIAIIPDNVVKATNGNVHIPDVILGLRDIAELHLYIAYQEKMIYLTAAGADYPGGEIARQEVASADLKARETHQTVTIYSANAPPPPVPLRPPFPEGLTLPVAISKHDCDYPFGYPAAAYVIGVEGTTEMSYIVSADGWVRDIEVRHSTGNAALDHAAIDCVLAWRFEPATLNGKDVDVVQTASKVWKLP